MGDFDEEGRPIYYAIDGRHRLAALRRMEGNKVPTSHIDIQIVAYFGLPLNIAKIMAHTINRAGDLQMGASIEDYSKLITDSIKEMVQGRIWSAPKDFTAKNLLKQIEKPGVDLDVNLIEKLFKWFETLNWKILQPTVAPDDFVESYVSTLMWWTDLMMTLDAHSLIELRAKFAKAGGHIDTLRKEKAEAEGTRQGAKTFIPKSISEHCTKKMAERNGFTRKDFEKLAYFLLRVQVMNRHVATREMVKKMCHFLHEKKQVENSKVDVFFEMVEEREKLDDAAKTAKSPTVWAEDKPCLYTVMRLLALPTLPETDAAEADERSSFAEPLYPTEAGFQKTKDIWGKDRAAQAMLSSLKIVRPESIIAEAPAGDLDGDESDGDNEMTTSSSNAGTVDGGQAASESDRHLDQASEYTSPDDTEEKEEQSSKAMGSDKGVREVEEAVGKRKKSDKKEDDEEDEEDDEEEDEETAGKKSDKKEDDEEDEEEETAPKRQPSKRVREQSGKMDVQEKEKDEDEEEGRNETSPPRKRQASTRQQAAGRKKTSQRGKKTSSEEEEEDEETAPERQAGSRKKKISSTKKKKPRRRLIDPATFFDMFDEQSHYVHQLEVADVEVKGAVFNAMLREVGKNSFRFGQPTLLILPPSFVVYADIPEFFHGLAPYWKTELPLVLVPIVGKAAADRKGVFVDEMRQVCMSPVEEMQWISDSTATPSTTTIEWVLFKDLNLGDEATAAARLRNDREEATKRSLLNTFVNHARAHDAIYHTHT
jgi:hypothetical protein